MRLAEELALAVVLACLLLPLAFLRAPDLVALWPAPVAISGDVPSIAMLPIPELRPQPYPAPRGPGA